MEMIEWLQKWLENDNTYVMYIIICYFMTQMLDMIAGTLIAKFSETIEFSSSVWKKGIIEKMLQFAIVVLLLPIFLIFKNIGLTAYITMVLGLLGSELYSLTGHFKGHDGKDDKFTIVTDALKKLFGGEENDKQ